MDVHIPHNYQPKPHQLQFLQHERRFSIGVWNRRAGKTKTVLNRQIMRCLERKRVAYYFLPTYRQAKAVVWDALLDQHLPKEVYTKKNEAELSIHYINGSIQRFAGCEDIDKHRGINPDDVVFDEYAEMDERIWTAIIQPVLRENKGTATFIFTPRGQNHAWRLLQRARDNPEWLVTEFNNDVTHTFPEGELGQMKREMPLDLFDQEVMCKFLEGAGAVFKKVHENLWHPPDELPAGSWQVGVDLAKFNDWTVITPFNVNEFRAYRQERFNQVDYVYQKDRIDSYYRGLSKSGDAGIVLDSSGVGEPIFDDLNARGIYVEPFGFTQQSKVQLINNLRIMLEQGKIKIPDDRGLIDELCSFAYQMNENGTVKMGAPQGMYDDRVISLALSVWGMMEPEVKLLCQQPAHVPYENDKNCPWRKSQKTGDYVKIYSFK